MKKTIIYCDVCGKQITGQVYKVFFGVQESAGIVADQCFDDIEKEMDFCVLCIGKVADAVRVLASPPALEETEEPKPVEEPKEKKPRKKVDAGKIWALHDAGWNSPSIALEVGCSSQTVYNVLAKDRPDMEVSNA